MSDVQLTFIVEPIESVITVQPNDITISLTETLLTVYSGSSPTPGGTNGQLQFNYNGTLDGVPDSNYFSGNLTLGNSSNIKITGGNNGYFLQTDGAGNLVWAAGTGNVSGNASSAGANTSIQISDGTGNFVAASGFLFNSGSNVLSAPGNGAFTGNVSASYFIGNGSQLTDIQLPSLISNGTSNISIPVANGAIRISSNGVANVLVINNNSANLSGNLFVTSGSITGNGIGLSSLVGANVTGTVANATHATLATYVTAAAQANITSLGTLTGLIVTGLSSIHSAIEKVNIITSPGATTAIAIPLLDQAITFYTANSTGNFNVNIIGNAGVSLDDVLAVGESITTSILVTNGAVGYYANVIQVQGNTVTPKWTGNTPVGGTNNAIDVYTFNIIKTAGATYAVFGSLLGYK